MMMSDGSLSQAEIDALLQSNDEPSAPTTVPDIPSPSVAPVIDVLLAEKILGTVVPQAEKVIKGLMNTKCVLRLISSEQLDLAALRHKAAPQAVQITHMLAGGEEIRHLLPEAAAAQFATHIIGQDGLEINGLVLGALEEAFSQFHEPLLHKIGDQRGQAMEVESTSTVAVKSSDISVDIIAPLLNTYELSVKREKIVFYEILSLALLSPVEVVESTEAFAAAELQESGFSSAPAAASVVKGASVGAPLAVGRGSGGAGAPPRVKSVMLGDFGSQASATHHGSLDLLMDVDMQLTVELGQTRKKVRDILQFGEGSIVELNKLAGEPVDVKVNQQLIAKGEVVVIDENFGVRITEIISPTDRIRHTG